MKNRFVMDGHEGDCLPTNLTSLFNKCVSDILKTIVAEPNSRLIPPASSVGSED